MLRRLSFSKQVRRENEGESGQVITFSKNNEELSSHLQSERKNFKGKTKFLKIALKGQSNEIFDLQFFSFIILTCLGH